MYKSMEPAWEAAALLVTWECMIHSCFSLAANE